jgi:ribosome-associated heat shock protein Hsp15
MSKVRVDKWLWSIRIFKTRTLATKACKAGNVKLEEGKILKPSAEISNGDKIIVRKNGINFTLEVLKLISKRVSSPLAKECYKDRTSKEELQKFESWYISAKGTEYREKGKGRPTKKERRELEDFKENIPNPFDWDDWDNF